MGIAEDIRKVVAGRIVVGVGIGHTGWLVAGEHMDFVAVRIDCS